MGQQQRHGLDDPKYDAWYKQQEATVDPKARQALVWKMEADLAASSGPTSSWSTNLITAHDAGWTSFTPTVVVLQVLLHLAAPDLVAG